MAHRYSASIAVELAPDGQPEAFTWRGLRCAVQVIGRWKLATRWWEPGEQVERTYYRCQAPDQQVFEVYHDTRGGWVLDAVLD